MAAQGRAQMVGLLMLCLLGTSGASSSAAHRGAAVRQAVTPVEKVIELLKKLDKQVEEDGKAEATAYDKYACFCKEHADGKLYAIETSTKKIAGQDEKISSLEADIGALNKDISALSTKISGLEDKIKNDTAARADDHAVYLGEDKFKVGAIDAVERAIAALQDSKKSMSGKVEAEALLQLRAAAGLALGAASRSSRLSLTDKQLAALNALAKGTQPGDAYGYKYHSNDIIAILENVRASFKGLKLQADQDEFDVNSIFEKQLLSDQNMKKFAAKEKAEKEEEEASKSEELKATQQDRDMEQGAMDADKSFMKVLKADCEGKADAWDQRSKMRAAELTAISQAMKFLEEGVEPNWSANKKLVGLQRSVPSATEHRAIVRPASFLQLRGSGGRGDSQRRRVQQLLQAAAGRLNSPVLSAAALKVRTSEDHFVKVRSIIKDLLARLEDQATAEQTTKGVCDTDMKAAVLSRDEEQGKKEDLEAQIAGKQARKAQLLAEIAAHSEQIASNNQAVLEATALRQDENKDNTKTIQDAGVGEEAVKAALDILKQFYEGQSALVQQRAGYVPPDSDRSGKTVADYAPKVFGNDDKYAGRQQDSKGIMGLLEVILADFGRTESTVTQAEAMSVEEFTTWKGEIQSDTDSEQGNVDSKDLEVSTIKDDLVTLKDSLMTATKKFDLAVKLLQGLESMCVEGEETYEERVAKREKEIEALKQAHAILEEWQG